VRGASVLTIAGVFSLLSAAVLIATIALGITMGGGGPMTIDFGDPATLALIGAGGQIGHLLTTMALVAPALALGAGIGWLDLGGRERGEVRAGVLLWYIGTLFIVTQDALELAAVETLPAAYQAATAEARSAVLALGAFATSAIRILTLLGSVVGDLGMLLIAAGLLARNDRLRIFGWVGIGAVLGRTAGLLIPALAPLRLLGFALLLVWLVGLGIAMLRQGSEGAKSATSSVR